MFPSDVARAHIMSAKILHPTLRRRKSRLPFTTGGPAVPCTTPSARFSGWSAILPAGWTPRRLS
jgi:hypothetical protein